LGPKVSLLANARLPLRRHSVADFSNAPRFTHFRHTMLKYVDLDRYSDGVILIGHRHNRPGADNSALAPRKPAFPNMAGTRQDQPPIETKITSTRQHAVLRRSLDSSAHKQACSALATSGYEPTSRHLPQRNPSQTRTSRSSRPSQPSRRISPIAAVTPRFVHQFVHVIATDIGKT
jgi:hypothetical protein